MTHEYFWWFSLFSQKRIRLRLGLRLGRSCLAGFDTKVFELHVQFFRNRSMRSFLLQCSYHGIDMVYLNTHNLSPKTWIFLYNSFLKCVQHAGIIWILKVFRTQAHLFHQSLGFLQGTLSSSLPCPPWIRADVLYLISSRRDIHCMRAGTFSIAFPTWPSMTWCMQNNKDKSQINEGGANGLFQALLPRASVSWWGSRSASWLRASKSVFIRLF